MEDEGAVSTGNTGNPLVGVFYETSPTEVDINHMNIVKTQT